MADGEDESPGLLRRRLLQATTASGATAGLSGCLGLLQGDDPGGDGSTGEDGNSSDERATHTGEMTDEFPDLETGPSAGFEQVASVIGTPTDAAFADDGRLFVVTQGGRILTADPGWTDSSDEPAPVLNLDDRVYQVPEAPEAGLLGIALHPDFAENGRFFLRYSAPTDDQVNGRSHAERLSEFHFPGPDEPADPDAERILLTVPQPTKRHNSGDVLFGPDGYLYLTTGNGGGEGIPPDWDWSGTWYPGVSQDTKGNLLGGVLRIDVDREGEDRPYGIPPDNPLADREGHRDEYYAWGFRNPWGTSFDGEDCYVADVGHNSYESVYRVEKGGNYGWAIREGTHCPYPHEPIDADCPDRTPDSVRGGEPFLGPVTEYPHATQEGGIGVAVIGGAVYRGDALPELQGKYVFGDLGGDADLPPLFVTAPPDDDEIDPYFQDRDLWPIRRLGYGEFPDSLLFAFGTDLEGEICLLGDTGVYRLVPADGE